MHLLSTLIALLTTWVWPLDPPVRVSRGFDPPATAYGAGHRGADLTAPPGSPVRAAGPGVVSVAGPLAGRGVVVVVHGSLRTTYEPVTASVGVGDIVEAGAQIGRLAPGHPGCPASACLHWGLRRGPDYLNPLDLVGAGPVRLLPLDASTPVRAPPWPALASTTPVREGRPAGGPWAARRGRSEGSGSGDRRGDAGPVEALLAESAAAVAGGSWLLRRRE